MGTLVVGEDLLDREDGGQSYLLQDADEVPQIGLFRHLEEDFSCEELSVPQDVAEFRSHEFIRVVVGICIGLYAAPGRTDDESIGTEGLHLQEVLIYVLEDVGRLLIDG